MTSVAMPTNVWITANDYSDMAVGTMNPVPSPSSYSNSSGDSQESNSMYVASPMSMSLSPQLIYIHDPVVEEMVGLPFLHIREEPVEKFRFRYKSEMMGTHGSILGRSSDKNRKKSYPSVELCNYDHPAIIRCSLYTAQKEESHRTPHTHRLVVRVDNDDKDDPHEILVSPDVGFHAVFQGMGIIHTAKKHITDELVKKKRARNLEIQKTRNINITTLTVKEEAQIRHDAEQEAKKMNLNSVSLCFEAFQKDANGFLHSICKQVFSNPINNMKSALTGELKICRIDKHVSSCMGGDEVFILVEKVGKKNIKIRFFEVDDDDIEIWSDFGKFSELDVHHQYAIVFRTPPYRDINIDNTVEVFVQLYRPTDGDCSEPIKFAYKPSEKISRSRKRPRSSLETGIPIVVEPDPRNFVCTTGFERDPLNTPGIDPVLLAGNNEEVLASFEQILNETEENGLNSSEFKEYLKNLSISDLNWTQTHQEIRYLGCENGKPANYIMDPVCAGFPYRNPGIGFSGCVKMERHAPSDYIQTWEQDECMQELTTDGPAKKPVKTYPPKTKRAQRREMEESTALESTVDKFDKCSINESIKIKKEVEKSVCESDLVKKIVEQLTELMQEKPPPDELAEKVITIFSEKNDCGDNALHAAISTEQKDLLKQMLTVLGRGQYTSIINSRNYKAETPLHVAVLSNQPEAIKLLLAVGANPDAVNGHGDTALHLSVEHSFNNCISELLDKSNYIIFKNKPSCNLKNYKGWTPLHLGALKHNLGAIQKLLEAGADVNEVDSSHGRSVLHMAVEEGQKEITTYLVTQTGVDVNLANYSGNTALHIACVVGGEGSVDLCKILINSKADPHKANYESRRKSLEEEGFGELVVVKQEPESDDELKIDLGDHFYDDEEDEEEEDVEKDCAGQTSFDLALNNKEILELLQKVEEQTAERSKSPDVVEVKEEMCVSPISDCSIPEDNGLFDGETLTLLCDILNKSKGWVNLAELLDYSFLVPSIRTASSPSKLLFNYADLHGNVTVQDIRNFLEALDEHQAVETIDLMLTKQSTVPC